MNEPVTTIVGNIAGEVELRFTPSGHAVANWTVASTPRTRKGDEWVDGETLWMRCSVWREAAENAAESLAKGTRVIVTGRLVSRSWEDKEGNKRTVVEMQVDEFGPSLRFAQATVRKTTRNSSGGGGFGGGGRSQAASDPWSTPVGAGAGGYGGDEPPFAHATGYDLAVHRGECIV